MKLEDLSNPDRPITATFTEIGDSCSGCIASEPAWEADQFDTSKRVLVVVLRADTGVHYRLYGRTQMPDAIAEAVVDAGAEALGVGGKLTVEFITNKGNMKVFKASYEPPADHDPPPF